MATAFQPIYKGRDFYVPAYDIKIKGLDLPAATRRDVMAVKFSDSIDQIDSFELTINNWDAEKRDFKYTGSTTGQKKDRDRLFDPGQEIELFMGFWKATGPGQPAGGQGPLRLMLAGIITSLTPSFPAGGQPTLKVTGQNVLRRFMTKQATRVFEKKKDSEIAKAVGDKGGFKIGNVVVKVRTDSNAEGQEAVNEHVLQDNQFDVLFLLQRAHRNGYDLVLKYETKNKKTTPYLFFGPSTNETRVSYVVEWGRSLISFQPTLTTTRQVGKVTVRAWDGVRSELIKVTVDRKKLDKKPLKDDDILRGLEQGFADKEEVIVDRPFRDKKEAERYAKDRLTRIARDFVTGRGSTLGTPDLRAGSVIQLAGLGATFSGKYFVKSTTHSIGPAGYVTDFDARLEEDK